MSTNKEPVALPRGAELVADELDLVTASRPCRIIIVAGEPDAGKTTLLTAIYEQFRLGPFAGLSFAGSRTLPAFEERCHLARTPSGRVTPETARTRARQQPGFLHLALRKQATGTLYNLLLSDISGEDFAAARDTTEDARRLDVVRVAARFCLLMDGATLCSRKERHVVVTNSRLLLRSLFEAGVLTETSKIELLVTKADRLAAATAKDRQFIQSAVDDMCSEFAPNVGSIRTGCVAARPEDGGSARDLDVLLEHWCADVTLNPVHYEPSGSDLETPYDRFLVSTVGKAL